MQPSGVNPAAPRVTDGTVRAFADRPELRARLRAALDRMLAFYGLRREAGRLKPAPTTEDGISRREPAPTTEGGISRREPAPTTEDSVGQLERAQMTDGADVGAGFSRPARAIVIDPARFGARAPNWLTPHNHNHLRLTRIMDSLATLGLAEDARALQRCLVEDIYDGVGRGRITRETYKYWVSAVPERQP